MADPVLFKIFLSSPGDVPQERDDAETVIDEINQSGEFAHHFILKLYRWDDKAVVLPMPVTDIPQKSVDIYMIRPSVCDLTVVLFWSRMGSPLVMDEREYLSGTHYEYSEALQGYQKVGKPAVWLYRCAKKPSIQLTDPKRDEKIRQFDSVDQFFKQFQDAGGRYTGGVNEYAMHTDFKGLFKGQLLTYLRHLRDIPYTDPARSRRFEAAMPSRIVQNAPTEIWTKISLPDSEGLRGELPAVVPSGDVIAKEDTRATSFPFKFPPDPHTGKPTSVFVSVRARSANLIFEQNELQIEFPPYADSQTVIFYATLKDDAVLESRIRVMLELIHENKLIAQVSVISLVKEAIRDVVAIRGWVVATAVLTAHDASAIMANQPEAYLSEERLRLSSENSEITKQVSPPILSDTEQGRLLHKIEQSSSKQLPLWGDLATVNKAPSQNEMGTYRLLDRIPRERIIEILLPHMQTEASRRASIRNALPNCSVLNKIDWSGPPLDFTRNLVDLLVDYGECSMGMPALVEVLTAIREDVGLDKQKEIDVLIAEIAQFSVSKGDEQYRQNYANRRRACTQLILLTSSAVILIAVVGALILPQLLNIQTGGSTPTAPATVASNNQWQPHVELFDGIEMVLVPAGCFTMGENGLGGQQCFDTPFWIDRYEVSNGQFAAFEGEARLPSNTTGENRPRTQVTWLEARAFCELRGARLPTEAEWEYAARGPDNLVYPWGNEWQPDYVAWLGNSNDETATVDSYPEGASWVGAFNMIGNVWEWTNSIFRDYPYDSTEGREDANNTTEERIMRGGAITEREDYSTTTGRFTGRVDGWYYNLGFRCARDFTSTDSPEGVTPTPINLSATATIHPVCTSDTVGPGGIVPDGYPATCLTPEQRQWLWEQFGHDEFAPVGYGGEDCPGSGQQKLEAIGQTCAP